MKQVTTIAVERSKLKNMAIVSLISLVSGGIVVVWGYLAGWDKMMDVGFALVFFGAGVFYTLLAVEGREVANG